MNVFTLTGTKNGWVSVQNLADPLADMQVYAFSFNRASPSSATLSWDAIFESNIVP